MKFDVRVDHLSDDALLQELSALNTKRNVITARLLSYLGEVERRKLYLREACPTMFDFCVRRLGLAEGAAAKRIWAARTARRLPVLFEMLARGEIHLTGIHLLARHLTEENHRELLERARKKTKREIEKLIVEIAPRPDVAPRIRALPPKPPCSNTKADRIAPAPAATADCDPKKAPASASFAQELAQGSPKPAEAEQTPEPSRASTVPGAKEPKPGRGKVAPLSPRRYEIRITVDEETHAALTQLQDLLGHQIPNGDPAAIISRALGCYLEKTLSRKAGLTDRPGRASAPKKRTRHIPAWIRRAVWQRDEGRCTYRDRFGRRCAARKCLEYHHIENWAEGGDHSVDTVTLRCRAHNQHQAELDYGEAFMKAARERTGRAGEEAASYAKCRPTERGDLPRRRPLHGRSSAPNAGGPASQSDPG